MKLTEKQQSVLDELRKIGRESFYRYRDSTPFLFQQDCECVRKGNQAHAFGLGGLTSSMLRGRFDAAREAAGVDKADFQMRDLRAKAGTDKAESSGDIMQAKDQLGHTTLVMTENYIRKRIGKKVTPTK